MFHQGIKIHVSKTHRPIISVQRIKDMHTDSELYVLFFNAHAVFFDGLDNIKREIDLKVAIFYGNFGTIRHEYLAS
jgi:hypothetical protein